MEKYIVVKKSELSAEGTMQDVENLEPSFYNAEPLRMVPKLPPSAQM